MRRIERFHNLYCDECGKTCEYLIEFDSHETDKEGSRICDSCLEDALIVIYGETDE